LFKNTRQPEIAENRRKNPENQALAKDFADGLSGSRFVGFRAIAAHLFKGGGVSTNSAQ
jgi:hypothetical protein